MILVRFSGDGTRLIMSKQSLRYQGLWLTFGIFCEALATNNGGSRKLIGSTVTFTHV